MYQSTEPGSQINMIDLKKELRVFLTCQIYDSEGRVFTLRAKISSSSTKFLIDGRKMLKKKNRTKLGSRDGSEIVDV